MPRRSDIQNQFTRGELSPKLRGRIDLEQFYQGVQTMENFLPMPHGGCVNRPGSVYVASVKTAGDTTGLIPFAFSTTDSYAIEVGDFYMRFFRNRAQVVVADTDAAITNGTFDSGITGWTDQSTGTTSIAHDGTNFSLQLNGDGADVAIAEQAPTTTATGTEHVLKFKVIGASTSGSINVRVGSASGGEQYLADVACKNGYHTVAFTPTASPFYIQFRNTESAAHDIDNVSLIDNAAVEIETPYAKADALELQYVQDADTMFIVHPDYKPMQLTRAGHSVWHLTSYTPTADPFTSTTNYPAAVAFFEQRIVFGYTATAPQGLFFSKSADVQNMTPGTGAADGFTKTIYASQANPIRWISGGTELVVGTTGGVWVVDRPASSPVTVSNFSIRRRTTAGVDYRKPVEIDNRVLFFERRGNGSARGKELRELKFDEASADFIAPNLGLLSDHITGTGINTMAWQEQGWVGAYEGVEITSVDRVLWMVRADGTLVSFTYNPLEFVLAWARHEIAGTSSAVESVCVIPGDDGDEVWMTVKRTINGGTVRYVEYLDPSMFLDSAIVGAGSSATTWSGLDHLEGETVTVLIDGSPNGTYTVSSGQITGTMAGDVAQIGLPFTPELQLMPLEFALQDGTSIGAPVSVARVVLRLIDTVGFAVTASNRTTAVQPPFRQVSDDVSEPVPPFTGDKPFAPPSSWSDSILKVTQPNPLPIQIAAIVMEMESHR